MMTLAAVLCCATVTLFSSCSSDDFVTKLEVDDKLASTGISAEIDGLVTSLGITSNDSWTVTIPEEAEEWIYLPTTSGKGNRNILVSIDANFGSAESRSTTLTVKAGDQTLEIPVIQRPTYKGEAVANGEETATKIAATKGVGLGYEVSDFKLGENPVVNLKAVQRLMESEDAYLYGDLFTYDSQTTATAAGAVVDSVESKKDSLGVALSFDITYGKFKLNIGGAYHGYENKKNLSDAFHYGGTYNVASASVDLPSIVALCENPEEYAGNDTDKRTMKALLTGGFLTAKKNVEGAKDSTSRDKAIKGLVDKFGLAVVSRCKLGGDIAFDIKFEVDTTGSTMRVDTAHVKTKIESGLLKLEAGVEVSYLKEAVDLLKKGAYKYSISGGSSQAFNELTAAIDQIREQNDNVDSVVREKLNAWIESIKASDSNTLSCTNVSIYPIWNFFNDNDVRAAVEKWVKDNYSKAYETLGIKDIK